MRNECADLKVEQFLEGEEYKDKEIWDLKYISTSDEEDNDSSEEESSDDEEEKDGKKEKGEIDNENTDKPSTPTKEVNEEESKSIDDPKRIWKITPGKNESVPQIAQKLRPAKKK